MKLQTWRKWILGGALVITCAECVFLSQNARPKYLRYVSQPLGDGTRYTFLYPARLYHETPWGVEGPADTDPITSLRDNMLVLSSWPQKTTFGAATEGISVIVEKKPEEEDEVVGCGVGEEEYVRIDNSRYLLTMRHRKAEDTSESWRTEHKVLTDSFQILPPGAPVPS